MEIEVREIKFDDRFIEDGKFVWRAAENAQVIKEGTIMGGTTILVQYKDGGYGFRKWDDPTTLIEIERGEDGEDN